MTSLFNDVKFRRARTIDTLRKLFPNAPWVFIPSGHVWESEAQGLHAWRVHTGGYDYNGEPLPGSSVYVYGLTGGGQPMWDLESYKPDRLAALLPVFKKPLE